MSIISQRLVANTNTQDVTLILKDSGFVLTSSPAQVDGQDRIIDIGTGKVEGDVIVKVTDIEVDSGNELYGIICQFSNDGTFASGVTSPLTLFAGVPNPIPGDITLGVGNYTLPFVNVFGDVHYRYMRQYTFILGAVVSGINYTSYIVYK